MIKINLLPKEFEKKAAIRQKVALIAGVAACVLLAIAGGYFMKVAKLASLKKEIAQVERELEELKPVVDKVNEIENKKKVLNRKLDVMKSLMESRTLYPVFMEKFTSILPSKVWITSLNTKTIQGGLSLSMNVLATDNYGVADFIGVLEDSEEFRDTKFTGITTVSGGAGEVRSFKIECTYYSGGGAAPIKEEAAPAPKKAPRKRR